MLAVSVRAIRISLVAGAAFLLLTALFSLFNPTQAAGPLPNGVAAGDATQTSAVLWARASATGSVLVEYTSDPTFSSGVLTVNATATTFLQPVKVQLSGLTSGAIYYYRLTDAAGATGQGHFRTAAATGTHPGLRFGVAGDWKAELAPYPSIANVPERNLDFFVEHGDTIVSGAATSLDEFRLKHNEVYASHLGLNTWADLRASTAILATIDDNEVRNDFAGGAPPSSDPRFDNTGSYINETLLFGRALQAFQEYNPLRDEFYGATGDPRTANKRKLYRFNRYGHDAAVFILESRSFRDQQLPAPTTELEALTFLTNSLNDTSRTLLGAQQLTELKADLQQAQTDGITWKFILTPGPIQNLGLFKAEDRFEGYAAERTDLLRFIEQNGIDNVVFIAAGLHGTLVNNLKYQETLFGSQTPTGAFEVIAGPVAIDPPSGPFGPAVIALAESTDPPLITPQEKADYDSRSREGKDDFIREFMDDKLITPSPLNYDPIGLDGSEIEATLLQGGYVAAHTYGWTEFEIDAGTQALTVTTYGVDFYTEAELNSNPDEVITRTPEIVSQFVVTPKNIPVPVISQTATPAGGSVVKPGDRITYTISVSNNGSPATNARVTDAIPSGAAYVPGSLSANLGSPNFDGTRVTVNVPNFPTGATLTATFQVTVTAQLTTTIVNTATFSSDQTGLLASNPVSHLVQPGASGPAKSYAYLPVLLKN